jgi:chromatin segregation and condensation protein Rec8/ScpA/Scc1 (kleisin family)
MDEFLANISKNIEIFYARLRREAARDVDLSFLKLTRDSTLLEAVRVFIMLLFLVMENRVRLTQREGQGDIMIALPEVAAAIA